MAKRNYFVKKDGKWVDFYSLSPDEQKKIRESNFEKLSDELMRGLGYDRRHSA